MHCSKWNVGKFDFRGNTNHVEEIAILLAFEKLSDSKSSCKYSSSNSIKENILKVFLNSSGKILFFLISFLK
jgi:hypothetical protein